MGENDKVYPAGTELRSIDRFDRSRKVLFHCPDHPQHVYASKDPFSSTWFPGDRWTTDNLGLGFRCKCQLTRWVILVSYTAAENGNY